jgi:hypothetical protein
MDNSPKTSKTHKTYASNYTRGDCQICCDNGLIIPCKICEKEACKTCIRKYIIDSDSDIPQCMFCSCAYNRGTLIDMLGKTFVTGEYTKHINKIVVKNNRLQLPTFQPKAIQTIEKNRLKKELDDLNQQMKDLKRKIEQTKGEMHMIDFSTQNTIKQQTRNCSVTGCNGFLDIDFKCGICSTITCSDCLETKLAYHVCDEDTKKTMTLLSSDTKDCPKCSFGIHKTDGCDQMYCTMCHAVFSWKTGKFSTGRIHNPHYFEYLRKISPDGQIRREEGDGQCGETVLTWRTPLSAIINKVIIHCMASKKDYIVENMDGINRFIDFFERYFIGMLTHARIILGNIEYNRSDINGANQKIRNANIDLLINNIDSIKYDKIIVANNMKNIFANEKLMLNMMLFDVFTDAVAKFYNDAEIPIMINDLDKIDITKDNVKYAKTCIEYYQKAKMFVETLKNDITFVIQYYEEEMWRLQTIYTRVRSDKKEFWNVHKKLLEDLSVNLDDIAPRKNGARRQDILNTQRIAAIIRRHGNNR